MPSRLRPVPGRPLTFAADGLTRPGDVTLVPLYKLFFQRYTVYWPVQSAEAYAQEQRAARQLAARTVDHVRVGEADSEAAHHFTFERSGTGGASDPFTHWRDAQGYFSYDVKVLPDAPIVLQCAYWGSDAGRTFDILVDGQAISTQQLTGSKPNEYLYVAYPIPVTLTHGKDHVTVRFVSHPGSTAGGLFDLRVQREEAGPPGASQASHAVAADVEATG